MNSLKKLIITLWIPCVLTGCLYGQCIDGPCSFERERIINNIKPYGAHWVKDGMTRESRREDLAICGSIGNEDVQFTKEQLKDAKLPDEPNEISAYLRLRDQLGACMRAHGYQPIGDLKYLGGCDSRCMYP